MASGSRQVIDELARQGVLSTDGAVRVVGGISLNREQAAIFEASLSGGQVPSLDLVDALKRRRDGVAAWLPDESTEPLFGLDRTPVDQPPLKPIPWWRFVRFRRWLCELIAGRDFNVE